MRLASRWWTLGAGTIILSIACVFVTSSQADASRDPSWMVGEPILSDKIAYQPSQATEHGCIPQKIAIVNVNLPQAECIFSNDGLSISSSLLYIRPGSDRYYHRLDGFYPPEDRSATGLYYVNGSGVAVRWYLNKSVDNKGELVLLSDIQDSLKTVYKRQNERVYRMLDEYDFIASDSNGPLITALRVGHSRNGRWLIAEVVERGLMRIDLMNDYKMELFSTQYVPPDQVRLNYLASAVSDDGRHVAIGGRGMPFKIYEINSTCAKQISSAEPLSLEGYQECPSVSLPHPGSWVNDVAFGDSNYEVLFREDGSFCDGIYSVWDHCPWRAVWANGYQGEQDSLQYLALGDSYSSGEGDVGDGGAYYLSGTQGLGQCHLSRRSYPFVLRSWWGLSAQAMSSIACSGAQILLDYVQQSASYRGQDNRLKELSPQQIDREKEIAINLRKPGIAPQIELVKKYKPRVVTLTGGGNDVGFAEILKYCASAALMLPVPLSDTCAYATEGLIANSLLKSSIDNQYGSMSRLIGELKVASPGVRVYVVGYPQFISANELCSYNAGFLDRDERQMLRDMTTRLNDVLSRAAVDAGAVFVDIEDALEGGQLCQGSMYVTGLYDLGIGKIGDDYLQESFHPNHLGHSKMAHAIFAKIPSITSHIDSLVRPGSRSSQEYLSAPTSKRVTVMKSTIDPETFQVIQAPKATFQPNSQVLVTMFSEPTELGSFTADATGGLAAGATIPDTIAPGYHTLVLEGATHSGEPITLYQFITVTSGITGDIDGDGMPDEDDRCNFIIEWVDEATGVDVCSTDVISEGGARHADDVQAKNSGNMTAFSRWGAQRLRDGSSLPEGRTQKDAATKLNDKTISDKTEGYSAISTYRAVGMVFAIVLSAMITIILLAWRKNAKTAGKK